jgi:hypothetical protein
MDDRRRRRPSSDDEYRRTLTDDEVRVLGYTHRDSTGRWVHRRELDQLEGARDQRARAHLARAERRCLTCGTDPHERDHLPWCDDATPSVGAASRDARDLEAAIAWQPNIKPRRLSPPEREQLGALFDALITRRQETA